MDGVDRTSDTQPDYDEQTDSGNDQERAQAVSGFRGSRRHVWGDIPIRHSYWLRWRGDGLSRRGYWSLGRAAGGAESTAAYPRCAAFHAIAHRSSLTGELHAPVAGAPFERVVGLYGARGTIAIIGKTIGGDVKTSDQGLFHGGGPTL